MACFCTCSPYSVEEGKLIDGNDNGWADEGEVVSYVAVVKNKGSVTLANLTVVDPRTNMTCKEPESGLLGQGEEYECTGSTKVRQHPWGLPRRAS